MLHHFQWLLWSSQSSTLPYPFWVTPQLRSLCNAEESADKPMTMSTCSFWLFCHTSCKLWGDWLYTDFGRHARMISVDFQGLAWGPRFESCATWSGTYLCQGLRGRWPFGDFSSLDFSLTQELGGRTQDYLLLLRQRPHGLHNCRSLTRACNPGSNWDDDCCASSLTECQICLVL